MDYRSDWCSRYFWKLCIYRYCCNVYWAHILGVVTPRQNGFAASIIERIEDLVVIILLPLYFTFSGLRTNIGTLNDALAWGLVALVIFTACVGKIVGATVASRLLGNTWRESFTVGILMNTRGLVELIVLNVGLDAGVLNTKVRTSNGVTLLRYLLYLF